MAAARNPKKRKPLFQLDDGGPEWSDDSAVRLGDVQPTGGYRMRPKDIAAHQEYEKLQKIHEKKKEDEEEAEKKIAADKEAQRLAEEKKAQALRDEALKAEKQEKQARLKVLQDKRKKEEAERRKWKKGLREGDDMDIDLDLPSPQARRRQAVLEELITAPPKVFFQRLTNLVDEVKRQDNSKGRDTFLDRANRLIEVLRANPYRPKDPKLLPEVAQVLADSEPEERFTQQLDLFKRAAEQERERSEPRHRPARQVEASKKKAREDPFQALLDQEVRDEDGRLSVLKKLSDLVAQMPRHQLKTALESDVMQNLKTVKWDRTNQFTNRVGILERLLGNAPPDQRPFLELLGLMTQHTTLELFLERLTAIKKEVTKKARVDAAELAELAALLEDELEDARPLVPERRDAPRAHAEEDEEDDDEPLARGPDIRHVGEDEEDDDDPLGLPRDRAEDQDDVPRSRAAAKKKRPESIASIRDRALNQRDHQLDYALQEFEKFKHLVEPTRFKKVKDGLGKRENQPLNQETFLSIIPILSPNVSRLQFDREFPRFQKNLASAVKMAPFDAAIAHGEKFETKQLFEALEYLSSDQVKFRDPTARVERLKNLVAEVNMPSQQDNFLGILKLLTDDISEQDFKKELRKIYKSLNMFQTSYMETLMEEKKIDFSGDAGQALLDWLYKADEIYYLVRNTDQKNRIPRIVDRLLALYEQGRHNDLLFLIGRGELLKGFTLPPPGHTSARPHGPTSVGGAEVSLDSSDKDFEDTLLSLLRTLAQSFDLEDVADVAAALRRGGPSITAFARLAQVPWRRQAQADLSRLEKFAVQHRAFDAQRLGDLIKRAGYHDFDPTFTRYTQKFAAQD